MTDRVAGWGRGVLLLPRVIRVSAKAPKDWRAGWERYWGDIRRTGIGGDVLWDSGDLDEVDTYRELISDHLDTALPLVDIGCGNGRFTRNLAPLFPRTVGADLSKNAIARARAEAQGAAGFGLGVGPGSDADGPNDTLTFRTIDVTVPGAGRDLAAALGQDANVFVRGVLHVLKPADRVVAARNILDVVGAGGRALISETNFPGSKLQYLQLLGARPGYIPEPLERAMANTPAPGHFGARQRQFVFPESDWRLVADGAADILAIPMGDARSAEHIPGYHAVLAPRHADRSLERS